MNGNMYLMLPVFLPMLAGVAIPFLKANRETRAKISVAFMFLLSILSVSALFFKGEIALTLWKITGSVKISFSMDGVSRFYVAFVSGVWALVGLYAWEYLEHDEKDARFWRYYLVSYGALMGLSMADNLITLYMFYECMTLVTMPLVAHNRDKESIAAAIKYLVYSVIGASLALFGIFFVGAYAGTFDFTAGGVFSQEVLNQNAGILRVVFFLMIAGFGVKAGMFPMHSWLPTAHPVAPAPASAVLSGVITKMGVLGIIRTIYYIAGVNFLRGTWVQYAFMTLALMTVVMGSTLALKEKVFKKRLAYSTVSQVSYVLFGVSTMTAAGLVGAFLHILFHSLIKNTLFMSAGAVIHKTELTNVDDLRGIGRRMPKTMFLFTVVSLGLIGIPPTGGFISKWNLAAGALSMEQGCAWIGPAALLLSAILPAAYLLSVSIRGFFTGEDASAVEKDEVSLRMLFPMGVLSCLSVILGIFPGAVIEFIASFVSTII
ncbi:MAG: proton-conducting membrane transporter [Clostridia bacterium]|nr:proton-conducting membrane transporter [Clostridia bacterium]